MTPLETVGQLFTWNVAPRFADHPLNRIMREHGDYVATGGRGMSGEVLFRLETFYHKLHSENLVIEYDAGIRIPLPRAARFRPWSHHSSEWTHEVGPA
jgi:hypothetical protein